MELFFMLSAMLALIVPIAIGRVRCIRMTPRQRHLFNRIASAFCNEDSLAFLWTRQASASTRAYCAALAANIPRHTSRAIWRNQAAHFVGPPPHQL